MTLFKCIFVVVYFSSQEDPTLERNFKGHRDAITSVDFTTTMKQTGTQSASFYYKNTHHHNHYMYNILNVKLMFCSSF